MVGRIIESGLDEFVAFAGVSHRYGQAAVVRDRPFVRIEQVDAGETHALQAAAQIGQGFPGRPAAQRLFQTAGSFRLACRNIGRGQGRHRARGGRSQDSAQRRTSIDTSFFPRHAFLPNLASRPIQNFPERRSLLR
jgi:hypothetical protein